MSDAPLQPQRSGILASNVGLEAAGEGERSRRGKFPFGVVLVGLVGVALGALGVLLLLGGTNSPPRQQAASTAARAVVQTAPQPLVDVNGISCDALESTLFHTHVHLAIFVDGQEQAIPFGVGIGQPWSVTDSGEGPFVDDGSCFYWIHTHTGDGILHIEAPIRRRFTLGDFFAIWQVPLSATQVGSAQGQIIAYVNGKRDDTNPSDIALTPHARIQLDVGQDVPPYAFDFPPGD